MDEDASIISTGTEYSAVEAAPAVSSSVLEPPGEEDDDWGDWE